MINPLHVAQVGESRLRFFRTPLEDGRPDFPWHAVDDLHLCLGLNRELRKIFLRKLRSGQQLVRTVPTAEGLVTIAPHYMAQGMIGAVIEAGIAPDSIRASYDAAGGEALKKLCSHLQFPSDAWFGWMKAALNRHEEQQFDKRRAPQRQGGRGTPS
jgi:hypothetical protein